MRPFQKCINQFPSSIITGVIDNRLTRRSGQPRFSGGKFFHFWEGRNSKNTRPIFLKFGTFVSLVDLN